MTTSATTALTLNTRGSPGRRRVALAVILAWLTWTFACPRAMVGFDGHVSETPGQVNQALASHGIYGDVDEDVSCTALQHLSTVIQKYDFKIPTTVFAFHAVSPAIIALANSVFIVTISRDWFSQSSPLTRRHSPTLGGIWPHAPPRMT